MDITVCIPVGPFKANHKWLYEALESVEKQTLQPHTILLIDDGAGLPENPLDPRFGWPQSRYYIYEAPWRLGVTHAFNFGVALAPTECVFMLGSDDTLEPTCLEECASAYERAGRRDAYYSVTIRYMSDGRLQDTPCNAAMVTKGLWKLTGGFPVEAVVAPDAALLSIMMVHMPNRIIQVRRSLNALPVPLYNYRDHEDTDTKQHGAYHAGSSVVEIRNILTDTWVQPTWTERFS